MLAPAPVLRPFKPVIPAATWQQVQELLAQFALPRRAGWLPGPVALRVPGISEATLAQTWQIGLWPGCAIWVLPAALLATIGSTSLRRVLLDANCLDILLPLPDPARLDAPARFWLLLVRRRHGRNLTGFIGPRPGSLPESWCAQQVAAACCAYWRKQAHPGYLPLPWDTVQYDLYRFGLPR
jgi:hypothetical protein